MRNGVIGSGARGGFVHDGPGTGAEDGVTAAVAFDDIHVEGAFEDGWAFRCWYRYFAACLRPDICLSLWLWCFEELCDGGDVR